MPVSHWNNYLKFNPVRHPVLSVLWVVATCGVILVAYGDTMNSGDHLLASHYSVTSGTFESYQGNQEFFHYGFTIDGVRYHGAATSVDHRVASIEAGAPFDVYYYPENPHINLPSDPIHRWNNDIGEAVVNSVMIIILITWAVVKLPRDETSG